jgi:hypothetical protein
MRAGSGNREVASSVDRIEIANIRYANTTNRIAIIAGPSRAAYSEIAGIASKESAMSELKLYEHELSGNSYKVRLFLSLLGLPFAA